MLYLLKILTFTLLTATASLNTSTDVKFSSVVLNDSNLQKVNSLQVEENNQSKELPFIIDSEQESETYIAQIAARGIRLHSGSTIQSRLEVDVSKAQDQQLEKCARVVEAVLSKMPQKIVNQVEELTLHFDESARRGLGGGGIIMLRCSNISDQELAAVLIHELAHVADSKILTGSQDSGESQFLDGRNPVYNNDQSLNFYTLSFEDETRKNSSSTSYDFVSGYAMSDPYEDFAESFTFYILHSNRFKLMATKNEILAKKYNFLNEKIFESKEFSTDFGSENIASEQEKYLRDYDSTLLTYNFDKLLDFN